jgi:hypothetical protein
MTVNPRLIRRIEHIADIKENEIQEAYYNKYYYLFEIVLGVLRKYDVLLYGGSAINALLPDKYKFYSATELPDIDVFCTADTYANMHSDLLKTFVKNGNMLTTIKEALHLNTYKLMSEGLLLLDITIVEKDTFATLKTGRIHTSFKLYTVNIEFLKYSLHTFICQPLDSHRWSKIYGRMLKFYETYPAHISKIPIDISKYYIDCRQIPKALIANVKMQIRNYNLVSFGWDIIERYLIDITDKTMAISQPEILKNSKYYPIQYVTVSNNSASNMAESIVNGLNDPNVRMIYVSDAHSMIPPYAAVAYNDIKFIYIFETDNCASYIKYKNGLQLSIHSIVRYLYLMYFGTKDPHLLATINHLVLLLFANLSSSKLQYKQFIVECYGKQKGLFTLRKEKFARVKNLSFRSM